MENIEKELRAKVGGILLKKSIGGGGGIITDVDFVSTLNKNSIVGVVKDFDFVSIFNLSFIFLSFSI